jgi:hypothetical protein
MLVPLVASVVVGLVVSAALPTAHSWPAAVLGWVVVLAVSTTALYGVDRLTRRLLPLATLLKLSMLFPDHAPSRFKVARSVAGTRALRLELERARESGVTGDRQQAAETILALVGALGDYDSRTRGHSERTQLFVTMLADELKLKPDDRDRLVWAALVHDIGKLRVPGEVLNKAGKPDDREWELLRRHPVDGAAICAPLLEWLGPWASAIIQHHERFDGRGYPFGLQGEQISLGGRIVAVADSYEVMTAARPYKRPMTPDAARKELADCAGGQFDPVVVRAFLNISLGRLRWVAGPLSWVVQLPFLQVLPSLGRAAAVVVAGVATTVSGVALGIAQWLPDLHHHARPATVASAQHAAKPPSSPSPTPASSSTAHPRPAAAGVATADPASPATAVSSSAPSSDSSAVPLPTTAPSPTDVPVPAPSATSTPATPSPTPTRTTAPPVVPPPVIPPANRAPSAVADVLVVDEDASATAVDVLANDTDVDGDTLSVLSVGTASIGTVQLSGGVVTYTPDADADGSDSFSYTVTDPDGLTSTATVTVTVRPVNDAPTAASDSLVVDEDASATAVDVLANDSDVDGDTLSVLSVGTASIGTVQLSGGVVTYVPNPNADGSDSFSYTVSDPDGLTSTATVTVTVRPVNDAPSAADDAYAVQVGGSVSGSVLDDDGDEDGDALTVVSDDSATVDVAPDGTFTWSPAAAGTTTFTYVVSDGTATSSATVTLTATNAPQSTGQLYLHGGPTAAVGVMTTTALTDSATDWDGDGSPGLTVKESDMKLTETDPAKFQVWSYAVPAGGLSFNGPVSLSLWSTPKQKASQDLDYTAWLDDCDSGGSCTTLTSVVHVHVKDWSTTTSWEKRVVGIGSVQQTVATGHTLRLRVAFNHSDLWLALDAAHPSSLLYATGG